MSTLNAVRAGFVRVIFGSTNEKAKNGKAAISYNGKKDGHDVQFKLEITNLLAPLQITREAAIAYLEENATEETYMNAKGETVAIEDPIVAASHVFGRLRVIETHRAVIRQRLEKGEALTTEDIRDVMAEAYTAAERAGRVAPSVSEAELDDVAPDLSPETKAALMALLASKKVKVTT
jgi:hypothetical protein